MSVRPARIPFFLVLAGLFLSGGSGAAAAEGRYVVVRRDGTTTTLAARPERKGDVLVGRLLVGGQLISFPATDVDEVKTAAANTEVPALAVRENPAVLKQAPRPAGESRKLVVRREYAERTLAASSGTAAGQPAPVAAAGAEPATGALPAGAADRNGHGEAWWKKRAAPLISRSVRAESDLARAAAARDAWQVSPGAGTPAWQLRLFHLNEAVTKSQLRLEEARRQQDRLSEEARKAGAYPGWIR